MHRTIDSGLLCLRHRNWKALENAIFVHSAPDLSGSLNVIIIAVVLPVICSYREVYRKLFSVNAPGP